MFTALDQNRAALKADATKVTPLVEQILIPNFDVDYSTRLVLAALLAHGHPRPAGRGSRRRSWRSSPAPMARRSSTSSAIA